MKHVTSLMGKKHMLLTLFMLLCSMRVAIAANQIITINVATPGTLNTMMGVTKKYAITALKLTGSITLTTSSSCAKWQDATTTSISTQASWNT